MSRLATKRATYDAEADAAYIELTFEIAPGRSVRNVEVDTGNGSTVALDFDGADVLRASSALDARFLAGAERIEAQ